MKKYILPIILFVVSHIFAQEKLNTYKYVVIPSQFEFQKEANQYGLNMLLKYKFQQLGFETYLDTDDLPKALKINSCTYIKPQLHHSSTFISTKISVSVVDCNQQVLFETQVGKSMSKSYKTSNNEALRIALKSFGDYRLQYTPITEEVDIAEINVTVADLTTQSKVVSFLYNGAEVFFDATNKLYYAEIKNKISNDLIGKVSRTSKSGIFHVQLNSKKGVGYYDETGNFIVEILEDNGNVTLQKLQLMN